MLSVCTRLANVYLQLNNAPKAIENFVTAKTTRTKLGGMGSAEGSQLVAQLGMLQQQSGELSDAIESYKQLKQIMMGNETLNTPDGAQLMHRLGSVQQELGLSHAVSLP